MKETVGITKTGLQVRTVIHLEDDEEPAPQTHSAARWKARNPDLARERARTYNRRWRERSPDAWKASYTATNRNRMTNKQKDALYWMAKGKTDAEIGKLLGLRATAVSKRITLILRHYKVPNRVCAVLTALARDDVPRDEILKEFA